MVGTDSAKKAANGRIDRGITNTSVQLEYLFQTFYHPYVCKFGKDLAAGGIDGLLQRTVQEDHRDYFNNKSAPDDYSPTGAVDPTYPVEDVDFTPGGAYSLYNWELFFHTPLLIAAKLSQNQHFEEAQKWLHYIFNPTDTDSDPTQTVPKKYWQTREFNERSDKDYNNQQIQNLIENLASNKADQNLANEVKVWRDNPFDPHIIARLRTTAYQKSVVMLYIDNLMAWGDQLFRQDTIESINEATLLYILAAEILGPRPETISPGVEPKIQTYNSLKKLGELGKFSDPQIDAENLVPAGNGGIVIPVNPPPLLPMFYFCIPQNNNLLSYWDKVADRLFKIEHCMNIEGVVQQLPLFEPPLDVSLLVQAAAAGIDISSAISDINAALPHYRFRIMLEKALELCGEVKTLGGMMLTALEKRDAEELSLLRSTHEIALLNAVRDIKKQQVDEAARNLEGLQKSLESATTKRDYYANLPFMNLPEIGHMGALALGIGFQISQGETETLANVLFAIPDIKGGCPTTIGATFGGSALGNLTKAFGSSIGIMASVNNTMGSMMQTLGGYMRRADEWDFQKRLAEKEIEQIGKQILAALIRQAVADDELQNHDLQISNAQEVDGLMHEKFTNQDLYDWMVGQISSVYFQSYQLAYDVSKRAEKTYRFELGIDDSSFIQPGYWDNLKRGLLAGEQLYHDLRRMEISYLDQNAREYEITKNISLAQLDPIALLKLKEKGECYFDLPEELYDADYPGHYMRRLKTVSVTIPCVTGPYAGVNCTLTLQKSKMRKTTTCKDAASYPESPKDSDPRFAYNFGATQSIVTSNAQNDAGLFEVNLHDDRYLPFEDLYAAGTWRAQIAKETTPQFDLASISDVILHVKYTAREGGDQLSGFANDWTQVYRQKDHLLRLFSAKHEFPDEFYSFLNPPEGQAGAQSLILSLSQDRFPYQPPGKIIKISKVELFLLIKDQSIYLADDSHYVGPPASSSIVLTTKPPNSPSAITSELNRDSLFGELPHAIIDFALGPKDTGLWELDAPESQKYTDDKGNPITYDISQIADELQTTVTISGTPHQRLKGDAIDDLIIVCHYTVN